MTFFTLTTLIGTNMTDQSTAAVATGAVTSPVWLPWLNTTSEFAALLAPILGALWLIIQIYSKIADRLNKGGERED